MESYAADKPDGLTTNYFYAGNVKSTINYKLGKKDGEEKEYYSNGNLSSTVSNYASGVQNGETREYYKSGPIKAIEQYSDGKSEGIYKDYFETGNLTTEGPESKDKTVGTWKYYYDSGKLKEIHNYANNYENGIHQEYFDNGQLSCTYTVKKGKNEGEADYYYKDGKLLSKCIYDGGILKSAAYFDWSGAQLSASTTVDTTMSLIIYSASGFKRAHPFYDRKGNLTVLTLYFILRGRLKRSILIKMTSLTARRLPITSMATKSRK